jgi:ribose 5-phosphate isomerase B
MDIALYTAAMKIAVASDHGGYALKEFVASALKEMGHEVKNLGAHDEQASDYPDFATAMAGALARGEAERGVLVCGSGVGICIAANKFPGIYAAICHDTYSAHQGVEHDGMNVLCLGGRIIGQALAREIVAAFVAAQPSDEERHQRRRGKVLAIEAKT